MDGIKVGLFSLSAGFIRRREIYGIVTFGLIDESLISGMYREVWECGCRPVTTWILGMSV